MRFSLKALFVAATACCLALGGWMVDARHQADAIRGIETLGGHVYYDETPWFSKSIDKWLASAFGKDALYRVPTACPTEATLEEALPHLVRFARP